MCISWLKYLFVKEEPVVDAPVTDPVDVPEPEVQESGETETVEEPIIVVPMPKPYEGINFHVLLDNGHASSTPGKRQLLEDGSYFFEYEFNRDVVQRIARKLDNLGIPYDIIVPEVEKDIALSERAARANSLCSKYGTANCFFISVHSNAFGDGKTFTDAKGWSVWTTKGPTKSDEYATIMFNTASDILPKYDMTTRSQMTDGDPDYEENFTVIYKTWCPAVLTENMFFTNKKEVSWLMTDEGRDAIADIHVEGIKRIIDNR
jgi:N-acetylmuramoyl-L-alanine amidase